MTDCKTLFQNYYCNKS